MALQYKIDAETHEGLDDSMRGLYVEKEIDGETYFTLDVEGAEGEDDIAGLRKALKEERQAAREAQHDLKALRKRLDGGEYDEEKTAEIETIRKEYETKLAEKDSTISKLENATVEKARAEKIAKAVASHDGNFELLEPLLDRKLAQNPDLDIDAEIARLREEQPSVFKPKFAHHEGTGGQPGMESAGSRTRQRRYKPRSQMTDREAIDAQKELGLDEYLRLPE